jgi:hypothetical protein
VVSAVLTTAAVLFVGCASHGQWESRAIDPTGRNLAPLTDSAPARQLLVDFSSRKFLDSRRTPRSASAVIPLAERRPESASGLDRIPDQAGLRALAERVSVDFAALAFAQEIGTDELSRATQAAFDGFLEDAPAVSEQSLRRPGAFPYAVLFAPSWLHRSHRDKGGDFARQRGLLDRLGIANTLVDTPESGTVEDNAAMIAAAIREVDDANGSLILVSASKSSAEVALALSRLLSPEETARVAGWVNVAGALRGTPLADVALSPPTSWFLRLVFWVQGWDWGGLVSMATEPSRRRLEDAKLPSSVAVVNLVPVPVSGSVSSQVAPFYKVLLDHGPNDGVVLLADTVWPHGANIVVLGADHLFATHRDDAYGLALMRAVDFAVRRHRAALSPRFPLGAAHSEPFAPVASRGSTSRGGSE